MMRYWFFMRDIFKCRVISIESDGFQWKLTAKIQQLKKQDKKLLITSQWKRAGSQ